MKNSAYAGDSEKPRSKAGVWLRKNKQQADDEERKNILQVI